METTETIETAESVKEFVPRCPDADGKDITLNSLVYLVSRPKAGERKPFRVREISYQYQGKDEQPKALLTLLGRKDRIGANRCAVVDESTDFGKVAALIERVGGRVDADAIYEYLGKSGCLEAIVDDEKEAMPSEERAVDGG